MNRFPPITEALADLEGDLHRARNPIRKQRLHLLVLIKRGSVTSQTEAAEHLALHRNTISRYLQHYRTGGLEGLLHLGAPGPSSGQQLLPPDVFEALKARLDKDGFASYIEAQHWLEKTYQLEVNYKSLHKRIRYRIGAKLKHARPRHPKRMRPKQPAS